MLRVEEQVEHHLPDLLAVREDRQGVRGGREASSSMFTCCRWYSRSCGCRAYQLVEIDQRPIGRAAARERQQVSDDLSGAHRFLAHQLEVGAVGRLGIVQHQFRAADDRLERIVDLVRDARDQLADRGEPLAVHELVAEPQILGDVALDADEVGHAAGGVPQRA